MSPFRRLLLHAHATGPNPVKIAIILEELQIPYEVKYWQFEDPNTGVVSWESGACINYVGRVYDKTHRLGPVGQTEQDIVDFEKWQLFLLTSLGPMMGQRNWYRHHNTVKNEDALQRYSSQVHRCFDILETQRGKSNGGSVLPGNVTAVDDHFEPWVRQYSFAGLSVDKYANIQKWLVRMAGREAANEAYMKIKGIAPG